MRPSLTVTAAYVVPFKSPPFANVRSKRDDCSAPRRAGD